MECAKSLLKSRWRELATGWESHLCNHDTFISSGCMLLSRLSRMFSDFPCVLDSSSARTQKPDVQNDRRSAALPESILQYLLTIAEKQFTETFPFLRRKIFPYVTSTRMYYYSPLGLSEAELQHRANFPGVLKFCHGFPIQRKGHVSLHFYSADYRLHYTKPFRMISCVSHSSCYLSRKKSTLFSRHTACILLEKGEGRRLLIN